MNSQKKRLFWKISSWMGRRIRDIDQFSTPILLRYKGDTEFKTEIGGFVSLSLLAFLIVYAWLLLKQMINRENIYLDKYSISQKYWDKKSKKLRLKVKKIETNFFF